MMKLPKTDPSLGWIIQMLLKGTTGDAKFNTDSCDFHFICGQTLLSVVSIYVKFKAIILKRIIKDLCSNGRIDNNSLVL